VVLVSRDPPGFEPPEDSGRPPGDDRPAKDPRDPRFDLAHARRARRRWLPRWALWLSVALVAAMAFNLVRFGASLARVADAVIFAGVICAPVVIGLLVLEGRVR
jgi:hypothetical protein